MGGLTPGVTRVTNRDLATFMIAVSDNSATNVLIDRVGMQNVNAMLDSLGLSSYPAAAQDDGCKGGPGGPRKPLHAARHDDVVRRLCTRGRC